jgi:hypothetical protein
MSAITPTAIPPVEITVVSEAVLEPRRLRRYRRAIRHSSLEGRRMIDRKPVRSMIGPDLIRPR